jgi:hypothetical protein
MNVGVMKDYKRRHLRASPTHWHPVFVFTPVSFLNPFFSIREHSAKDAAG